MYDFHSDKKHYFEMQYNNSRDSIIPFISPYLNLNNQTHVLEIGCAEAGVLKSFLDYGCQCVGVELSPSRVELAKEFTRAEYESGQVRFFSKNIYDVDFDTEIETKFDLVILKDVIEHIHDQERFMARLLDFLNPGGFVFFGFPPFAMPFGGHQQICVNRFAAKLPYYHLLPEFMYRFILKRFGETDDKIEALLEIKETGISIERFERIFKRNQYKLIKRLFYFVAPIYKYKFNMKPRLQNGFISRLLYIRDFVTMSAYYIIQKPHKNGRA